VFTVYHHQNCGLADKSLSLGLEPNAGSYYYIYQPSQEFHNVALIIADLIIQNKNRLLMVRNQQ
jgi:hypothetical protein